MSEPSAPEDPALTLLGAGVSRAAATRLLDAVAPLMRATHVHGRVLPTTGFCAAIALDDRRALVATTDGVGSKRVLMRERMDALGRDLVAYNVNDVATVGAQPLAFLDYLSCGRLDPARDAALLAGMASACSEARCVRLGGETAEHPGVQRPEELDVAGFAVGVCEIAALVDGSTAQPGDAIVGLASSGPHASGFSLIRAAHERAGREVPGAFLTATRIYVEAVARARATCEVRALANICDGGLTENIPRALPLALAARIDPSSWPMPGWVRELEQLGCAQDELRRVVNMGIGYALVVPADACAALIAVLERDGQRCWRIGTVLERGSGEPIAYDG